jgi:5'-methylthioadenosine phosphorylase
MKRVLLQSHETAIVLRAKRLVARLAADFPREHELCPIGSDRALDSALITAPDARSRATRQARRVVGPVLKARS